MSSAPATDGTTSPRANRPLAGITVIDFGQIDQGPYATLLMAKAGGFSGMAEAYAAMGDRADHMKLVGVFSAADYINFLLPVFLLVMAIFY